MSESTPIYTTWEAMAGESVPLPPDDAAPEWYDKFNRYVQYTRDRAIATVRDCDEVLYGRRDKTIPERIR